MKVEQALWTKNNGWEPKTLGTNVQNATIVFIFGDKTLLADHSEFDYIKDSYPNAIHIATSTSGEIHDTLVEEGSLSLLAIEFEKSHIHSTSTSVSAHPDSESIGKTLGQNLDTDGLKHVFVLSDGIGVNGTALVNSLQAELPENVFITGGLAGDAARFESTIVGNLSEPNTDNIVAIGFYGDHLHVGYGSQSGWVPFGPIRKVTKSDNNVLYELDGESALELYKKYLGEHAKGLPSTGLLFPLNIKFNDEKEDLIRTLLAIDEDKQSMTFAGDIPEGESAQLMTASTDQLVTGAEKAAKKAINVLGKDEPDCAILVSCVGRKLIMKQRVEEEVEQVKSTLGDNVILSGFYSYGEICPDSSGSFNALHNQTMTITTFKED